MKRSLFILLLIGICGCGTGNRLKKYFTPEDNTVFELVERLQKNDADSEAISLLPQAYQAAVDKRKAMNQANYQSLAPGDRYLQLVKEFGVMQQMYDKINALPAAKKAVPNLWNPSAAIVKAQNNAAKEYYNQGLEYMTYDNRQAAKNAYDYFSKANNIVPGYEDVRILMQEALDRATIKVVVRAANYYHYNWSHWGFQNDWLQQQLINDLNAQSFRDVRFYSDWDAGNRRIRPDRIVELTQLYRTVCGPGFQQPLYHQPQQTNTNGLHQIKSATTNLYHGVCQSTGKQALYAKQGNTRVQNLRPAYRKKPVI